MKKELELQVFQRDKNVCQGCHGTFPTKYEVEPDPRKNNFLVVDHVDGLSEELRNLQSLCWVCNSLKAGKGQSAFRLSLALKRLGPCVTYYPSLARIMGLKESIFLCQLIYWTPRARHERGDGWLYKSVEEMEVETGLSYKEQLRLRKSLIKQKLLEEKYDREEHNMYFRVNTEELDRQAEHMTNGHMPKSKVAGDQREGGTLPKGRSYKETEITQENTQINTPPLLPGMDDTDVIRRVFCYFVEQTEKHPKLCTLTATKLSMGMARFKDCMRITGGDPERAEKLMKLVIDTLVESDFHMGRGEYKGKSKYNEWKHIFNSTDKLEQWIERSRQ